MVASKSPLGVIVITDGRLGPRACFDDVLTDKAFFLGKWVASKSDSDELSCLPMILAAFWAAERSDDMRPLSSSFSIRDSLGLFEFSLGGVIVALVCILILSEAFVEAVRRGDLYSLAAGVSSLRFLEVEDIGRTNNENRVQNSIVSGGILVGITSRQGSGRAHFRNKAKATESPRRDDRFLSVSKKLRRIEDFPNAYLIRISYSF